MLKKSKVLITIALALLLCVTSAATAFATNLNEDGLLPGTEENPIQAAITKNLRLPTGTNVPSAEFTFVVEPKTVDGVPYSSAPLNMPPLGTNNEITISFSQDDAIRKAPVDGLINTDSIRKETTDIFADVTFPHAGVFVYEITEMPNTNPMIDALTNINEWLSYSGAKYTLTAYVKYKAPPNDTETYVYALATVVTTPEPGQPGGGKVDPTPGGDKERYLFSEMVFTNDYVKNNGPVDPETGSTLIVSKQVAGDFASKDQIFDFTISLTIPSIVPNPPAYYKAYLRDTDGAVIIPYIEVSTTAGAETSFSLKHGQSLVFVDTPVGVGYVATEAVAVNYIPSVSVITSGGMPNNIPGALNTALPTGPQLVGELANSAAFTNTRDSVTPTGLNLNNLPFILLIGLGLGTLTTYIAVKVRQRKHYGK